MEFLKIAKRRSFLSEVIYVALNIGLAIAFVITVRVTGSLLPAFGLVLLSKWRVLAVRPRYWWANINGDLVSLVVASSFVVFLYNLQTLSTDYWTGMIAQLILAALYAGWLIILRPLSKRKYVAMQAGISLLTGVTAVFTMSYWWDATPVVLLIWIIGYATARHIINTYDDEDHTKLLSLAWGFVLAEIGWLAYHWTVAYRLPLLGGLLVPQVSIIMIGLGFLVYKSYDLFYHKQQIRIGDIFLPLVFVVNMIGVLILWFNNPIDDYVGVISLVITLLIVCAVEGLIYFLIRQKFFSKK